MLNNMACRIVLVAALFSGTAQTALAYDTLEADYKICAQGDVNSQAEAMLGACTRLIDNSSGEGEILGFFYAIRASVNTDRQASCSDSKKAVSLFKDANMRKSAQDLADKVC